MQSRGLTAKRLGDPARVDSSPRVMPLFVASAAAGTA